MANPLTKVLWAQKDFWLREHIREHAKAPPPDSRTAIGSVSGRKGLNSEGNTQAQKHTPKTRQASRAAADTTRRCAETKAVTRVQLCPLRSGKEASPERRWHRQSQERTQTRQGSLRETEEHRQCKTFPVHREQQDDPDRPMRDTCGSETWKSEGS